ncbi:LEPR-XLL domain-containing protein, partial [bacterium]|nr:LEPR-XLL domain-containing protein [bacterium]
MARRKDNRIIPRNRKRIMRLRESNSLLQKESHKEDIFKVDNLEERVLLSADPVLGPGYLALLNENQQDHPQAAIEIVENFHLEQNSASLQNISHPQNDHIIDLADLEYSSSAMDSALLIGDQDILGGSGSIAGTLINQGIVAPGYSPGIQNVTDYIQIDTATLSMEIAGTGVAGAADGFDQLNVTSNAQLEGTLSISLLNNFKPQIGDTYDIITFDTVTGSFDNVEGLYGFKEDYYFEFVESEHKISLVVKELIKGDGISLVNSTAAESNALADLINYKYLADSFSSVQFSGDLKISDDLSWTGDFVFTLESQESEYTLADGSTVNVEVFTIGGRDVSAVLGGSKGLSFSDVDFAISIFNTVDSSDDRSWVVGKGSMGGASFLNFSEMGIMTSDFELDVNLAFGAGNSTVIDLSLDEITVADDIGVLATFNEDGSDGERLSVSGAAEITIGDFETSGKYWFTKNNSVIEAAAENVSVRLKTNSLEIGLEAGNLGLVLSDAGVAMQASGTIILDGVGFDVPSADSISAKFNNTNIDYTDHQIAIGANSYQFGALEASSNLLEISVKGLNANLFDSFKMTGDYGFKKSANRMDIVSNNASIGFDIGGFSAGVSGASFGLVVENDKVAFEASGAIDFNLGDAVSISADKVTVRYNDSGTSFTGETLSTAGLNYTFADLGASTSLNEVTIEGGKIKVSDFFTLNGDFAIKKEDATLLLSDQSEVDANMLTIVGANLNAFAGIGIDSSDAIGFNLQDVGFSLNIVSDQNDSSRKWTSLKATTGAASFTGVDGLTADASNLLVEINTQSTDGLVIDYLSQALTVDLGSSETLVLDMNGESGELLTIAGDLNVSIQNFFSLEGGFAFTKSTDTVILSDGSSVNVDLLTLGASGLSAFAGINKGQSNELGFTLNNADVALAIVKDKTNTSREWLSLKANVESAKFSGSDLMTMTSSDVVIEINTAVNDLVIDYSIKDLIIKTNAINSLALSMDGSQGELIQLRANLSLNVRDFFTIDGGFAFSKSSTNITLSDTTTRTVDVLTLGGNKVSAFVGLNGGSSDEFGFRLSDMDFGLAFFQDKSDQTLSWMSLYGSAVSSSFTGSPELGITSSNLEIELNSQDKNGLVVDYNLQNYSILTSKDTSINLTMDGSKGELLKLSGHLDLNIFNFFTVNGSFAFEKSSTNLTLKDGSNVDVDLITLGANNVSAFAGINGGEDNAFGFELTGSSMALVLATDQEDSTRKWTTLSASSSSVAFVGIEGLTAESNLLDVQINAAAIDGSVIDYKAKSLDVQVATGVVKTIDLDGQKDELVQITGNLKLNVFNFFTVNGGFAFVKQVDTGVLADGSEVEVDLLTLGANNVSAFAGLNGDSANKIGFGLANLNFGLALMSDKNNRDRDWLALKGNVGNASFEGIDGLTLAANNMKVELNLFTGKEGASTQEIITEEVVEEVVVDNVKTTTTTTKKNTIFSLKLNSYDGQINVKHNGQTKSFSITSDEQDSSIISKIKSSFESFSDIGAGNVLVTLVDGETLIELNNSLEGQSIKGFVIETVEKSLISSVVKIANQVTGANEKQIIKIDVDTSITKTNTVYKLNANKTIGHLTFSYNNSSQSLDIFKEDDNAIVLAKIESALELLTGIGVGKVQVSGSKLDGFNIEFINTLAGKDINSLTVKTVKHDMSKNVFQTQSATKGSNESQTLTITAELSASGKYKLTYDGQTTGEIRFANSDITNNKRYIKEALEALSNVQTGDIKVIFNQKSTIKVQEYQILFKNSLGHKNFDLMAVDNALLNNAIVSVGERVDGVEGFGETQRVNIQSKSSGGFQLKLDYNNTVYTTTTIDFDAKASVIEDRLNTALSFVGGKVSVVEIGTGIWDVSFEGKLKSKSLSNLQVVDKRSLVKALVDVTTIGKTSGGSADGSFVLEINSQKTKTIQYGSTAENVARIQSALESLSSIGQGNVIVSVSGTGNNQVYAIEFTNLHKFENISDLIISKDAVNAASLSAINGSGDGASDGLAQIGETQRVSIQTESKGSFKLSLDYNSKKYTTLSMDLSVDAQTLENVLNSAFKKIDGSVKVSKVVSADSEIWDVQFLGSLATSSLSPLKITTSIDVVTPDALLIQVGETKVDVNTETISSTELKVSEVTTILEHPADFVVDFSTNNLEVLTSGSTTIALDMDGARGNSISASGNFDVNVFNFFSINGDFAFEKFDSSVQLSDGNSHDVELLTFGGSNVSAFAGLNGGSADALGLSMQNVDFSLATYQSKTDDTLSWTSVKAEAGSASFVGIPSITIDASDLLLEINMADKNGLVIDHLSQETTIKIADNKYMTLDMDGAKSEMLVVAGDIDLDLAGFLSVKGGFAFTKSSDTVVLSDGSTIDVDLMTLGAND